jgi:hypothetical protein
MGSNVRRRPLVPAAAAHAVTKDARKGRLREECLARVQQQRDAMLWQLRQVRCMARVSGSLAADAGGAFASMHELRPRAV